MERGAVRVSGSLIQLNTCDLWEGVKWVTLNDIHN